MVIVYVIPAHGASFSFDKATYTWTDKIFIRIVAPDFDFDTHAINEIGNDSFNPIKISTRGHTLDHYKLVETGVSTGVFTGEVILTGFCHDADGNTNTGIRTQNSQCNRGDDTNPRTEPSRNGGPTNGFLEASNDDGITVAFEYTKNKTILGSAPIKWNIGDIQWQESNYSSTGTGLIRVIDPDMNLNPEAIDNFDIDVWSDSDVGGIDITVTETGEMTGIFEGSVFFTTTSKSSGNRLLVSQGDIITAEYEDNTLPNPYAIADELNISAITSIGEIISNLQTISVDNASVSDRLGNLLSEISVDQQFQITADLQNNTFKNQPFTYLVQIRDSDEVTVHLAWITGMLTPGQVLSPSLSWSSQNPGTYDVTTFVWKSLSDPAPLSSPASLVIDVR